MSFVTINREQIDIAKIEVVLDLRARDAAV